MNRINLLKDALISCEIALEKSPNIFFFPILINQIKYLLDLEEGRTYDLTKLKTIKIGWIAARELDGFPDEKLKDKLHLVSAEAEKMKKERLAS